MSTSSSTRVRVLTLASAALLLGALPLAFAHDVHHGAPVEAMDMQSAPPPVDSSSYWRLSQHASLMYWHIALEMLAWLVILPVAVMLSIARSRLVLASQFLFLVVNALGLLLGFVYNHETPELYQNNAHAKTGWIITCIASAWVLMALIQAYTARSTFESMDKEAGDQLNVANMTRYQRVQDTHDMYRWSNDSGHGTERDSASLFAHSRSPSVESEEQQQFIGQHQRVIQEDEDEFDAEVEKRGFLSNNSVDRFLSRNIGRFAASKPPKFLRFFYVLIERTILVQGFVAITTGTIVYGGIGRGGAVFNVLAHYIKGGIFFGYGLLTLGRWMGAFADFGWAWNIKPPVDVVGHRRAAMPSAEFTESFVIFLYGCSNVFLEHLAAWGDAWTAQDLEHVSISVMFFGGGLLGMIIESTRVRDLLNNGLLSIQPLSDTNTNAVEQWQPPRQYRISMNPMPALIILLLGKMMSSHHQASMLSTMIHSQWGSMFMMFALARALTYITLYISPPTSYLPSRPPTEIITAFCLIAGGVTFMVSNKDTVAALEGYGLDAMFTFTVTMGVVALLMAWTVVLIAVKGWAMRRESRSLGVKGMAGVLA